jgi:hypothetical protein
MRNVSIHGAVRVAQYCHDLHHQSYNSPLVGRVYLLVACHQRQILPMLFVFLNERLGEYIIYIHDTAAATTNNTNNVSSVSIRRYGNILDLHTSKNAAGCTSKILCCIFSTLCIRDYCNLQC